jgi:hypothetical protein
MVYFQRSFFLNPIWFSFLFISLFMSSLVSPLFADTIYYGPNPEILEERARVGKVLAGVTLIGLGVGIGCLAADNGRRVHCYSSNLSSYPSSYSTYSTYSTYSSQHLNSKYKSFSNKSSLRNLYQCVSFLTPLSSSQPLAREEQTLSGFFSLPDWGKEEGEEMIPFIQFPNGCCIRLDVNSQHSLISFGPFDQKGQYLFGLMIQHISSLDSVEKRGSIEIKINNQFLYNKNFTIPLIHSAEPLVIDTYDLL